MFALAAPTFLYSGPLDSDTKSQYHFQHEQHTP
jgi:hypothetical protein